MSNVIAVYNFKGGVGKTSTTLNLALNWAQAFKVLVIDCDPQANLTTALTNTDKHTPNLFSISKQLLHNGQPKIEPIEISYYLHLIPGAYDMTSLESNSQFISFGHIIFYNLLNSLRSQYDLIILDCPTHFGITVRSFLANIDSILIPAVPDSFSVMGFKKLLSYLNDLETEKKVNILGVYFNQFRRNTLLHQEVLEQANGELGRLILNQTVRESIRVSEAHARHESIYNFEDSDVVDDFLKLSEEVIERLNAIDLEEVIEEHLGDDKQLDSQSSLNQTVH